MNDYETENETHVDIEIEYENNCSKHDFNYFVYQVPRLTRTGLATYRQLQYPKMLLLATQNLPLTFGSSLAVFLFFFKANCRGCALHAEAPCSPEITEVTCINTSDAKRETLPVH